MTHDTFEQTQWFGAYGSVVSKFFKTNRSKRFFVSVIQKTGCLLCQSTGLYRHMNTNRRESKTLQ